MPLGMGGLPLAWFEWLEETAVAQAIRQSTWLFPAVEAAHLLALCALGGALLVVDLRLLGVGLRATPIDELAREARPWLVRSVALLVVTGAALFASEAVKCYHNPSFRVKMATLPVALVYTFAVRQRAAAGGALVTSARSRLLGAVSIALWLTVAAAGRWIGFSS